MMSPLRRCVLALCVGGLMLPASWAAEATRQQQPAAAEASLIEAESQRFEAQIAGNIMALAEMLADEVVYTHANGRVQGKADYLQGLKAGAVHYQGIEVADRVARVYENFGLTVGTITLSVGGDRKLVSRYTGVYASRDGRWQLLAWQATDIRAPAGKQAP